MCHNTFRWSSSPSLHHVMHQFLKGYVSDANLDTKLQVFCPRKPYEAILFSIKCYFKTLNLIINDNSLPCRTGAVLLSCWSIGKGPCEFLKSTLSSYLKIFTAGAGIIYRKNYSKSIEMIVFIMLHSWSPAGIYWVRLSGSFGCCCRWEFQKLLIVEPTRPNPFLLSCGRESVAKQSCVLG